MFRMEGNRKKSERGMDDAFNASIMKESGERFQIDDYTITMERYLYDQEMQLASVIFRVDRNHSKPESDIMENISERLVTNFGAGFHFKNNGKAEYKGDSLYIYYQENGKHLAKNMNEQGDTSIELLGSSYSEPLYRFTLKNTEKPKEIKSEEGKMIKISSLGISVLKEDSDKLDYICLKFKDGSKLRVLDRKDTYTLFDTYSYVEKNVAEFCKPIDTSKIDEIVIK